ncbi:hypothetical protein BDV18DRAFT_139496 [Aspergillus unguis]
MDSCLAYPAERLSRSSCKITWKVRWPCLNHLASGDRCGKLVGQATVVRVGHVETHRASPALCGTAPRHPPPILDTRRAVRWIKTALGTSNPA